VISCSLSSCANPAVVQWSRRPTAAELSALIYAEQSRRDEVLLLASPDLPTPSFGDLPTTAGTVVPVFGCLQHAVSVDLAPFVHLSTCTAPNPATLPKCDCSPEPLPQSAIIPPAPALPSGWS
jgi:hypothetical protein